MQRSLAAVAILTWACGGTGPGAEEPQNLPRLELQASDVTDVRVRGDGDERSLDVSLTPDATRRLQEFTAAHVGERVAILVDGERVMEPVVREPIADGHLEITAESEGELRAIGERLSAD